MPPIRVNSGYLSEVTSLRFNVGRAAAPETGNMMTERRSGMAPPRTNQSQTPQVAILKEEKSLAIKSNSGKKCGTA